MRVESTVCVWLLPFIIIICFSITNAQSQFAGCFDNAACSGTDLGASSARDCCVNIAVATHYSDGGSCLVCTVYGFRQNRLEERERGQGYSIEIGYIKGPPMVTDIIRGRINTRPGGTAGLTDFQISSTSFTIRPTTAQDIIVTFCVDRIALEPVEIAQLGLEITTPAGGIPGAFLIDTLDLFITDSDRVTFQLTESDFSASEEEGRIISRVSKNLRIANPVELLLTPYTVDGARASNVSLDEVNVPPDDNRLSPNRAQLAEGREDFSNNAIPVQFEADEIGAMITAVHIPIVIIDDSIDEAREEFFVININSTNNNIDISHGSSLGIIIDNDELQIGFQNMMYTFIEPDFEMEVFDTVFLEKQDDVHTEQTYIVGIRVNEVTPNPGIPPATLNTQDADNDYRLFSLLGETSLVLEFPPDAQTIEVSFTLFPDQVSEGTEAFQVTLQPSEQSIHPFFTAPTTLFPNTFIVIEDNDPVDCGPAPAVTNGVSLFISGTTTLNSRVNYTCESGYLLSGSLTVTCQSIGTWNLPPTCQAVCQELTLTNGMVTYNPTSSFRLEGAVATHSCDTGYMLSGGTTRTCQNNRMWSGADITCNSVCSELPAIANGMISYAVDMEAPFEPATVATYSCNLSYRLELNLGTETRTCENGGAFNGTAPICVAVCEILPAIENGMISYAMDMEAPFELATVATYSCIPGYQLNPGTEKRTCEDAGDGNGGVFNGRAPTCVLSIASPTPSVVLGVILAVAIAVIVVLVISLIITAKQLQNYARTQSGKADTQSDNVAYEDPTLTIYEDVDRKPDVAGAGHSAIELRECPAYQVSGHGGMVEEQIYDN